jgi:hypothetical protein
LYVFVSLSLSFSLSLSHSSSRLHSPYGPGIQLVSSGTIFPDQFLDNWSVTTDDSSGNALFLWEPHHMHDTCERDRSRIPLLQQQVLSVNYRFLWKWLSTLVKVGIWTRTVLLFAFVWKGLTGICYLDSVALSVKGGIC